jgi:hypothetical protein
MKAVETTAFGESVQDLLTSCRSGIRAGYEDRLIVFAKLVRCRASIWINLEISAAGSASPAAAEGSVELDDGGQFRLAQARQGQFSLE